MAVYSIHNTASNIKRHSEQNGVDQAATHLQLWLTLILTINRESNACPQRLASLHVLHNKMKPVPIVGVLLVMVTQTIAFAVLWNWMVTSAHSHGRFPQEIAFGLTIHYGAILIAGLFVVCGLVAFLTSKPRLRWFGIFTGLLAWTFFLWPALDSRPYALPAFFALGATILIGGTGFGVPYFQRLSARTAVRSTNGEQNAAEQPATRL